MSSHPGSRNGVFYPDSHGPAPWDPTPREACEDAAIPLTVDDMISAACADLEAALADPDAESLTAIGAGIDDWGPSMGDLRDLGRLAEALVVTRDAHRASR